MESAKENSKLVKVSYNVESIFRLPKELDLDDISIVESWWIRNGKLYIRFRQPSEGKDEVLIIKPTIEPTLDLKYPKDILIINADD